MALQWSDTTLNLYIDKGLQYMHRQIMKIDPEAIVYTATLDVTASTADYPRPANMQRDMYVYQKASASAAYGLLEYTPYYKVAEAVAGSSLTGYARKGRFVVLIPTPTASVTAGMKLEYIPTLTIGADTDTPDIVEDIHEGIVFRAEMLSMGDCGLDAPTAEKELAAIIVDLPLYYKKTEAPQRVELDVTGWTQK